MSISANSPPLKLVAKRKSEPSSYNARPAARTPRQQAKDEPDAQRLPPYSEGAEKGVLGAICQEPLVAMPECQGHLLPGFFYNPVHLTIYSVLAELYRDGQPIDLISFTQELRDRKLLDTVGGAAYVTSFFTSADLGLMSASNVGYYIDVLRDKFILREMIRAGTNLVRRAYGAGEDDPADLLTDAVDSVERIKRAAGGANGSERFEFERLMAFDSKNDPKCLVGNRYLVKGGSSLWAGGSGYGKSSLALQLAVYWGCGVPCFGLRPVRPLKSLIVQAENDEGDMSEQLQGVIAGIASSGDLDMVTSRELIEKNVGIHQVIGKTGKPFLGLLDQLLEIDRPDMAWIDPLFAFAGCDLLNPEKTGRFLREGLFPLAIKRGVAMNVVHHVGKPNRDKDSSPIAEIDLQYLGFGTSEIQNAFRAVNILLPVSGEAGLFRLGLSKRGERAGALDAEGNWTRSLYLTHSKEGICWLQASEPEKPARVGGRSSTLSTGTIEDLFNLIPPTGSIEKNVLLQAAAEPSRGDKRIGLNKGRAYLTALIDAGRAFEWRIKRPKTNPRIEIARHAQTLL
jgi:hypothetical protein